MRYLIALAALVGLGTMAYQASSTRASARAFMDKAERMEATVGVEAGAIAYRGVADRFPFSPEGGRARAALFRIRTEVLATAKGRAGGSILALDSILVDPLYLKADPHAGVLSLALVAAIFCLFCLMRPRSRVRGLALLLLVVLLAVSTAVQTHVGLQFLMRQGAELSVGLYRGFPWIAGAGLLLSALLLMVPLRKAED